MLGDQGVHATRASGAEKKTMDSFVLLKDKSYEEEQIWVRKVLLLFRYFVWQIKRAIKWHSYSLQSAYSL